uniref:Monodehydroascorbate reductase n=1 Tax=Tanacetum cinerariifolium TaxID=118510 RepID=A0A6L2L778_TANCI|nr:hypothetical protein [Tanacetum cinerariifolium]
MADENIPAPTPTRFDDQILPFAAWVPIRKSKFILDHQRKQKNPIFQIFVDILQNTNFFRAFTASALLDETRFVLDANLLRDALEITPIDQAYQFVSPPSGDAIMDFLKQLGYTEAIHFVSRMAVNNLYQPWRAILSIINQCLTGKTSGHDRPRYPVLQMLWGIITSTNVDYAELLWEEVVQAIQMFLTDKANLGSPTKNDKKDKPYGGKKKPAIAKQPNPKPAKEKSSKPAHIPKPKATKEKPANPSPVKPLKMGKVLKTRKGKSYLQLIDEEEPSQPEPEHQGERDEFDVERSIQMSLESFQAQSQAHVSSMAIREPVAEATRPLPVVEGKAIEVASTGPCAQPQDDASANIVHESLSPVDAETVADTDKTNSGGDTEILHIDEDQGKDVNNQVDLEEKTVELDQGQARSGPGKTLESRPLVEQEFIEEDQARLDSGVSHVALSGPNPEPTHEEFMANVYPDVHGSLKLPADKHVSLEEPLSSSRTLSSMNNLDDAYTFGDQFLDDKSTEDDPGKLNIDSEVVYMVMVLIHQASSLVPLLSTPIIDFSPPKPVPATTQAPIFTATTMNTTTTLPLPPPSPQQSTSNSNLAIDQTVNIVFKDSVHIALKAPLRDRFKELLKADMKEIHQRMFESGSYKSLPEHVALYEALKASMEWENRDEFLAEKDKQKSASHSEQQIKKEPMPDTANISDLEDTESAHLPKIKPRPEWLKPILEEDRLETLKPDWIGKKKLSKSNLKGPAFKDLEYLVSGDKGRRSALSISKLKVAHYLDSGIEELVTSLWNESERVYDISAAYDISHWCLKTYERYGYAFLKEIVLHRADYKEYKISKADFKNLHPNDFEDLYLLHLQGQLNHLCGDNRAHLFNVVNMWIRNIIIRKRVEDLQLRVESYQTKLNLTQPD